MIPSVFSTELLESGPSSMRPGRWRLPAGVILTAVTVTAAARLLPDPGAVDGTPPVQYVEAWIDAWNDRDAQTLSSMTCDYIPAFVPAGVFESALGRAPASRPIVAEYAVTGTEPAVAYGRTGVRVELSYVPGPGHHPAEEPVRARARGRRSVHRLLPRLVIRRLRPFGGRGIARAAHLRQDPPTRRYASGRMRPRPAGKG